MRPKSKRTPAEDRGEIQSGMTQDKTPGFDPAAAPQETDAEAGEYASSARPASRHRSSFSNQASFDNAMRRPENGQPGLQPSRNGSVLVIAAFVALAAIAFVLAALLS